MPNSNRRKFLGQASLLLASTSTPFYILKGQNKLDKNILGHGDFTYRLDKDWGNLDSNKYPVNNCHEMVMDSQGRLILLTDHPQNNILIYDKSGKLLDSWTLGYTGAHGLSIHQEGGEDYLFITDVASGQVVKTTTTGRIVMSIKKPVFTNDYPACAAYKPTETTIAPNGDIYIADGYGSQFILRYNSKGEFISKFGGDSFLQPDKFKQAHGVTLDTRDKNNPTLLCSARIKNTIKRFSLEGQHLEDIYLPGAFISRIVVDEQNLYSGVCFGMTPDNFNMQLNLGFVTILDKNNKVVSNPGGTKPTYKNGKLQIMTQSQPIFKHCHDVCVDNDKNLYVCQWNAGKVYPSKLVRV